MPPGIAVPELQYPLIILSERRCNPWYSSVGNLLKRTLLTMILCNIRLSSYLHILIVSYHMNCNIPANQTRPMDRGTPQHQRELK
jgi:hypothetical protein